MSAARSTAAIVALVIPAFLLGCAFGYLVHYGQVVARRMNSDDRFAQLTLALDNYYNNHGQFPPLVWRSTKDGPAHSWRVTLLPYLDQQAVFDEYDSSQPWNSQTNLRLARGFTRGTPANFISPLAEECIWGATNYIGVSQVTKQWPAVTNYYARRTHMITRNNECFIIVEVPDSDINWMEPRDTVGSK